MALPFRLQKYEGGDIPDGAIPGPTKDGDPRTPYVAVLDAESNAAFGFAMKTGRVEAWFPWGGDEEHREAGEFSFMIRKPGHRYRWCYVSKFKANPRRFNAIEVDGISPASFDGRLGKLRLSTMEGWTSYDGYEEKKEQDEVKGAYVLCVRKFKQKRSADPNAIGFQDVSAGDDLPRRAVQSRHCKFDSYVAMTEFGIEPTFGRASLNKDRNGLQAWFPYDGEEHSMDQFKILCAGPGLKMYWPFMRNVIHHPDQHKVFKYEGQTPAVVNGILGKCVIDENGDDTEAWYGCDGMEIEADEDEVAEARVLCYKAARQEGESTDSWSDSD